MALTFFHKEAFNIQKRRSCIPLAIASWTDQLLSNAHLCGNRGNAVVRQCDSAMRLEVEKEASKREVDVDGNALPGVCRRLTPLVILHGAATTYRPTRRARDSSILYIISALKSPGSLLRGVVDFVGGWLPSEKRTAARLPQFQQVVRCSSPD